MIEPRGKTLSISQKVDLQTSTDKLWRVISSPGNLINYHPFCKDNPTEKWSGVGAEDSVVYYNGKMLNRYFIHWEEGIGYELLIGDGKVAHARVKWEILDNGQSGCQLKIDFLIFTDVTLKVFPGFLRELVVLLKFKPLMKNYLNALIQGAKFYAENDTAVHKNQFGYNKMFSTK